MANVEINDLTLDASPAATNEIELQRTAGGLTRKTTLAGAMTNVLLSDHAATTSAQLAGIISDETGSGGLVFATSPTLVTPALGTPASGVATNLTGTAAGLTAGTVTTNANLTGDVTSVGNATTIAAKAVDIAMLADGTDGELITWDSSGVAAAVAVGTAAQVLTSNGAGAAPTFQAAGGGAPTVSAGLTAGTTQTQAGGLDLTSDINEVSTCANVDDTVVLRTASAGIRCTIINNGAQRCQVFPASGDNLGAGVDAADEESILPGGQRTYEAYDATNWEYPIPRSSLIGRGIFTLGQWGYYSPGSSGTSLRTTGLNDTTTAVDASSSLVRSADGAAIRQDTGSTINTDANIEGAVDNIRLDQLPLAVFKWQLGSVADVRFLSSIALDGTNLDADDIGKRAVGIQFSTARPDTNFQFVAHDGTTQTLVDSGVAGDTAVHFTKIESIVGTTDVRVSLLDSNFVEQASTTFATAVLPAVTAQMQTVWQGIQNLAASSKTIDQFYGTILLRNS